jgi:hypothetical protein
MQTVEKIYRELEELTKIIGLTINTMKAKVMIQSRRDVSCQQTDILGIETVDSFTYLGPELTKGNEEEVEIQADNYVSKQGILFPIKGKAVPLHAMEVLGGRGGIVSTHSRPRH